MFKKLFKNLYIIIFSFFILSSGTISLAGSEIKRIEPPDTSFSLLRLIFSLILVFLIFYAFVYLFKFISNKKGFFPEKRQIKILDVQHPGTNLSLYLIESEGKKILVGANTNQITLLESSEIKDFQVQKPEEKNNKNENKLDNSFKTFINKLTFVGGEKHEENS